MQDARQLVPRTILFFVVFASIGICVWFLNLYAALFNSFLLAMMIVMTASPMGFWLRDHGLPRWLSLMLSVVVALTATLLIAGVLIVTAIRLLDAVPMVVQGLAEMENDTGRLLSQFGVSVTELQQVVPPEAAARTATNILQLLVESVSMFGLVILIVVFMIIEAFLLPEKIENKDRLEMLPTAIAVDYVERVRQYVGITSLLGMAGGAILSFVLHRLGVPFPAHWGILYFVLSFVPVLGFWIAVLPPMLVAGQAGGASLALLVLVAYLIVATIANQGIKPAVMREGLDLSPFWSIASIIIWSTILGPVGLIVGVPLTVALKVLILEPDPSTRWIADLLGAGIQVADNAPPTQEPSG